MDIVFNIVDTLPKESMICITIVFREKYNVSIGRDANDITVYFYETAKQNILKFSGSLKGKKYLSMKKYILEQVGDIPIYSINGITDVENREILSKNFIVSDNPISSAIIDIKKIFI